MEDMIRVESTNIIEKQAINEELYTRFLNYLDVRPKTVETYKKAIRQFLVYLQENDIRYPERDDVIRFRDRLKENHKPSTVQLYIIAVKQFFKWLAQEGIYQDITVNVKGAKLDRSHKKDYLTQSQSHRMMEKIDRETMKGKRDYAILAAMITGGLRTIEVIRADIQDLGTAGGSTVLYLQGKGHDEKADYVKIPEPVEEAIRDYLAERKRAKATDPLFASLSHQNMGKRMTTRAVSGIVKDHLIEAGYNSDRLTAHSMRHTAATLNLLNGGSLEETQQLLRHTNINTTMIYLHNLERANNNSEARIAAAVFG